MTDLVERLRQRENVPTHDPRVVSTDALAVEAAAEIERLRARVAELEADALRFDWYFGPADKQEFLLRYLEGVRAGWSVDQWRAEIDAVRLPFMKESSR